MGMFDNVRCEYPLPGLEDPTGIDFQTKSTEPQFLEDFRITADGVLEIEEYDVEDRSDPNAEGFLRWVGCATRIPTGWRPVEFNGVLNFYGDANTGQMLMVDFLKGEKSILTEAGTEPVPDAEWFEYNAVFEHGQLLSVERVYGLLKS